MAAASTVSCGHCCHGVPGVIVFLDFEKAFDRLDRAWIEQCMAAVGFGAGAQRWVHILHTGTIARVAFNGWHTDAFPVSSGVFHGSPLSPLLFVIATQPMAADGSMDVPCKGFPDFMP